MANISPGKQRRILKFDSHLKRQSRAFKDSNHCQDSLFSCKQQKIIFKSVLQGTSLAILQLRFASSSGGMSLIPGQGVKIPHASWPKKKKKKIKQKQHCKKFNKDFKNGSHLKKKSVLYKPLRMGKLGQEGSEILFFSHQEWLFKSWLWNYE